MTTDELNDALDALQAAAADDETRRPGLIEVSVDDWIQSLAEMQTTRPKTIVDGIRIRDITVAVSVRADTRLLSRGEAGEQGAALPRSRAPRLPRRRRPGQRAAGRFTARSKVIRSKPGGRQKVQRQGIG